MRIWIDLANSPHVPLFERVVHALTSRGDEVVLTARDHAQTLELARRVWPNVTVVGAASPSGRLAKTRAILDRSRALRRYARDAQPDIALSHGSYAQILAARTARIPAVTMMDYEYQPANHVSFRLARKVIVPKIFPESALKRFGGRGKIVRYDGFKEEIYLGGIQADERVLTTLGLDAAGVTSVMRPPPEGALYHRGANRRFDEVYEHARAQNAQIVVLPRSGKQARRYRHPGTVVPERLPDGRVLLATADLTIGAGGTMTRESALLGTPTYTVFLAQLAAVDRELIRLGQLIDLRSGGMPIIERKSQNAPDRDFTKRGRAGIETILRVLDEVSR